MRNIEEGLLVNIRLYLDRYGWSEISIEMNDEQGAVLKTNIAMSHVIKDPWNDILFFCEDLIEKKYPTHFKVQSEPGSSLLEISAEGTEKVPMMKLYSTDKDFTDKENFELEWEYPVNVSFLITQFIAEFSKIKLLLNHECYQVDRSSFPVHEFVKLKKVWLDRNIT